MTKVVNGKQKRYDIYIGRRKGNTIHHYGNPFTHLPLTRTQASVRVESRDAAVEAYRNWLLGKDHNDVEPERREWILQNLGQLKGKTLACHCKPLACHGDVLVELVDERN